MTFIEVAHLGFGEIMQTAMVYKAATRCILGNDASALFWTDSWLGKRRLEHIVPRDESKGGRGGARPPLTIFSSP